MARLCSGLVFVLVIFAAPVYGQPNPTLRFGTVAGYERWDAVLKDAFGVLGYDLVIEEIPNARALQMIENGTLDGLTMRTLNVLHPGTVPVFVPYRSDEIHVYSLGTNFSIPDVGVLKGRSVGSILGSLSTQPFAEATGAVLLKDNATLFRMLAEKRLEFVISPAPPTTELLKELGLEEKVVTHPPALLLVDKGLVLLEKHRDLVPRLTEQLKKLKALGRF